MRKLMLSLSVFALLFSGCKENAAEKIKSENIAVAAKRDANTGKLPAITFDKTVHDFGKIKDGTPVETKFKYTNTGNSMLVVSNIKSTCGCTVPKDFQKEVAPGETAEFTVNFNGKGNGKVTKSLTMVTNTEKGNEVVRITAEVEKDPNAPAKTLAKPSAKLSR